MPIGRYIAWVGASLLVLLFVANWIIPQSLAEPTGDEVNRPVIRIASMQQPPERIVIDTNLPTIVPPLSQAANAIPDEPPPQVQSYTSIVSHMPVTGVEKKKQKAKKKQVNETRLQPNNHLRVAARRRLRRLPGCHSRISFLDS